jgi:molybdate transport system permease protein
MDMQALWLTLRLALTTTGLLLMAAVPLAWWIAGPGVGRGDGAGAGVGRALVQAVVAVPLVLPPTVLGFYLLVALGPLTAPGRMIIALLGHPLAFSFEGLVVGSVIYSLPFAVQPLVAGFGAVDAALIETAATLGASPMRAFRTITLPLARSSVVTAAVLTFTHTVGEFGVVLMLGGNIPGATRTLSIALYDQVQDFNYAAANRTAGMLLGFSLMALVVIYARRGIRRSLFA